MGEHLVERVADRPEVALGQDRRGNRRQPPVLSGGVEIVRRRTDPCAGHEQGAVGPGGGAVRGDADGEVEIEADPHPSRARPVLGLGELQVGDPLEPAVEHDEIVLVLREDLHRLVCRVSVRFRPARPGRAVALRHHRLRQRLEQRVEVERLAFLGDEAVEAGDEAFVVPIHERCGRAGRGRAA